MAMENRNSTDPENRDFFKEIPSLIQIISSNEVEGFDSVKGHFSFDNQSQQTEAAPSTSSAMVSESADAQSQSKESHIINHQRMQSISMPLDLASISLPNSPTREAELKNPKSVLFNVNDIEMSNGISNSSDGVHQKSAKCYSQPMPKGRVLDGPVETAANFTQHPSIARFKDRRFDSFKTWSGKLERQLTNLRGKPLEEEPEERTKKSDREQINLPVDRYFDALEGPELDTLRASEEIVLPDDRTWPFLLRYPVSSFGICLGVSSQAILWKTLATSESTKFLHISKDINLILWFISVALVVIISSIYLMKTLLYFEAVRREYYHPIRVNFFFAPWIALLFLALGVPPSVTKTLPEPLWYILMTPIFCFALKLYGQWMSGGQRRLSKVANPSNHLAVVGNFVGALLGASMGLKEGPIFFFAVGLAHYTVLFVTLYQRLPTNATLPKELHPVFFLFVAAPSVASMAWAKINGSFDYGSRIAYFIAMFLYFSLAVRINFFRGFKFSLAWWAYTFPMTGAAIATIRYSNEVTNVVTRGLVIILSAVATLTVTALLVTTILHAFVLRDLFPNDIAIAISDKRPKHHHHHRKWFHIRNGSSEQNDIENFLKFACPDSKDVEAGVAPPSTDAKVV